MDKRMKKKLVYALIACVLSGVNALATNYYVSTAGSDSNNGTSLSSPFANITKAITKAYAGDVIYVRGGTYLYTSKISISRDGTADEPISLEAYQGEDVIVDFSGMTTDGSNRGFSLSGNYWVIKDIRVHKAGDNGMNISGSYNYIENCEFFANRDTGLQLGGGASNNKIINCDSYGNADPSDYGDADGFACKIDVGDNNYFYGCRAWLNVDDGWDGYMKSQDIIPHTTLENCWTWMNGYFLDGSDPGSSANGNGFKVGGSNSKDMDHNFTLIDCVSFDNKSKGFDQNNNTGSIKFYNCIAYRNIGKNYSIPRALSSGNTAEVINCISLNGDVSLGSFVSQNTNSWSSGFSVSTSDFITLDTTGVSGPRNDDGSLPDLDLFRLKQGSELIDEGTDLGYSYNGNAPDLGAFESNYNSTDIITTEIGNTIELNVIDNPVISELKLLLNSQVDTNGNLKIIALTGNVVLTRDVEVAKGNQMFDINVSHLNAGMYILAFKLETGACVQKFIKASI